MHVKDIEVVQGLIRSLEIQMSKLSTLAVATNIHVEFNGTERVRMNFSENPATLVNPDTHNGDYDFSEAYEFFENVLNARIKYLRDRLATYGVVVEG